MQSFDPPGPPWPLPIPAGVERTAPASSLPGDAAITTHDEKGPTDGSRLAASVHDWARRREGRFHYRLSCRSGPGQLPAAALLRGRLHALTPSLPPAWIAALVDGWPPPLQGLHRIELVPGIAWVSVAIGLAPAPVRRMSRPAPGLVPAVDARPRALEVLVVGAGLAGGAVADALLRRGWRVTVIEAAARVGGAVAGIPRLAQHPALSPGDDRRSRLLVSALLTTARLASRFGDAMTWCGRFQPMPLAEARRRTSGIPATVAEPVGSSEASLHGFAGCEGIWYPRCALADPERWWRRLRAAPELDLRLSRAVAAVSHRSGRWQALDEQGAVIASAPAMVLANQAGALGLASMPPAASGRLRLSRSRAAVGTAVPGLPAAPRPRPTILGGDSYRLEDPGNCCVIGPIPAELQSLQDHRIGLPGLTIGDPGYRWHLSDPAERLLLRDSLPMIGAVPDVGAVMAERSRYERNDRLPLPRRADLHVLTGLGGRGLLWSVLGAEMIAAGLNDEPPVVEPDLQDAVDPARFLKRGLRRARTAAGA